MRTWKGSEVYCHDDEFYVPMREAGRRITRLTEQLAEVGAERDELRKAALRLVDGLRKQFPTDVALAEKLADAIQEGEEGDG